MFAWWVDNIRNGKCSWPQHNKNIFKILEFQQAACWDHHIYLEQGHLFCVFYEKSSKFIVSVSIYVYIYKKTWFLKPSSQNWDLELHWDRSAVIAAGSHWSPACGEHASVSNALSDEKSLRIQEFETASQCLIVLQLWPKQTKTRKTKQQQQQEMLGDLPKARQWELLKKV